jgi:hypothetical protein
VKKIVYKNWKWFSNGRSRGGFRGSVSTHPLTFGRSRGEFRGVRMHPPPLLWKRCHNRVKIFSILIMEPRIENQYILMVETPLWEVPGSTPDLVIIIWYLDNQMCGTRLVCGYRLSADISSVTGRLPYYRPWQLKNAVYGMLKRQGTIGALCCVNSTNSNTHSALCVACIDYWWSEIRNIQCLCNPELCNVSSLMQCASWKFTHCFRILKINRHIIRTFKSILYEVCNKSIWVCFIFAPGSWHFSL